MEQIKKDDFFRQLETVSREKVAEHLLSLTKPCYESELLKIAFDLESISSLDSLSLYQHHFLLYYLLYTLQDEFYKENKYLHIHFMRTFLSDYPAPGQCRFYDQYSGTFCHEKTEEPAESYCSFHREKVGDLEIEHLSTKYFYYDIENFFKLDKKTAEDFMNGSWEILGSYDKIRESFKILDLPETSGIELIKQRFKELAKKYHPDVSGDNHTKFNRINNAYRILIKTVSLNNPFV